MNSDSCRWNSSGEGGPLKIVRFMMFPVLNSQGRCGFIAASAIRPTREGTDSAPSNDFPTVVWFQDKSALQEKHAVRTKASPTKAFSELTGSVPIMEPLLLDAIRPRNVRTEQTK
jgi:hypothetical protein